MIRKLIICIAVLVGFCPMAWGTVDDVPNPKTYNADNWVSDPDHILDSETKNKINNILQQLEDSLTIEVAVVALNSIGEEDPHEFAVTLFNRWGVGKAEDDNGLLILLTRDIRDITFKTGYGPVSYTHLYQLLESRFGLFKFSVQEKLFGLRQALCRSVACAA